MLHSVVVMKVTNEKKGIFLSYLHNRNKKFQSEQFRLQWVFMFRLKVLIINKSKIHIINVSNCTLYIVKFFIGFDILVWPIFVDFQNEADSLYELITHLIKT